MGREQKREAKQRKSYETSAGKNRIGKSHEIHGYILREYDCFSRTDLHEHIRQRGRRLITGARHDADRSARQEIAARNGSDGSGLVEERGEGE
jgi:hypothetical protein